MAVSKVQTVPNAALIQQVAQKHTDLTKAQIKSVCAAFAQAVFVNLVDGHKVVLQDIGTLYAKPTPERKVRNPKTGESKLKPASAG
jgi:nucleoid DNA-binding protein